MDDRMQDAGVGTPQDPMVDGDAIEGLVNDLMNLKKLRRTGWCLRGIRDGESLADHCFGVVFLTWFLGRHLAVGSLDIDRAVSLAIIHEIGECRIGDVPFPALRYLSEKSAAEQMAVADMMTDLGPTGELTVGLFAEFEAGGSLEARFVRAVDKLEMLFTAAHYEKTGYRALGDFWQNPATFKVFADFPALAAIAERLRERRVTRIGAEPPGSVAP